MKICKELNSDYFAFLKLKKNEIAIFASEESSLFSSITPVFDIPRVKNETSDTVIKSVTTGFKNLKKWPSDKHFFLDCKDIITLDINNMHIYEYVLKQARLQQIPALPVLSLSRDPRHNQAIIASNSDNPYGIIGIRVDENDLVDYQYFIDEISIYTNALPSSKFVLLIDCEVIRDEKERSEYLELISYFLEEHNSSPIEDHINFEHIVVTASSLTGEFGEHTTAGSNNTLHRHEGHLYLELLHNNYSVTNGDYGIVSSEYSDSDISPQLIWKVSTPKLIYTSKYHLYIFRGKSLEKHGLEQFFDLAKMITSLEIYRGEGYSSGDMMIYEHAIKNRPKATSQGNWYKFLNIAHFSFIKKDFL
jgi:hypothetical protein